MADVIKEFLVSLGFKYDEHGLRRFEQQVNTTRVAIKSFAVAAAGMALSIEESIRRTAREFENLFYLSQRTNISIDKLKAIDLAFKQIGLQGEQMTAQFAQFNLQLMQTPGLRHVVQAFSGAFKDPEQAMTNMAGKLQDLIKLYGRESAAVSSFLANAQQMGFDIPSLVQLTDNLKDYVDWQKRAADIRKAFGFGGAEDEKRARQGVLAAQAWNAAWFTVRTTVERLSVATFPALNKVLGWFTDWMRDEGSKRIQQWGKDLEEWLAKPETEVAAKKLFTSITNGVEALVGWLSKVSKPASLDSINSGLEKMATLFDKIAWAIGKIAEHPKIAGPIIGAALGYQVAGRYGAIAGAIGGYGVGAASEVTEREWAWRAAQEDYENNPNDKRTREEFGRDWERRNYPGKFSDDIDFGGGGDVYDRPHSYGGSPVPAFPSMPSEMGDALYLGFRHWWSGSSAFRPMVILGGEVYKEITDLLREVFGLNPAAGATTSGSGGGMPGGATPASYSPGAGGGGGAGAGGGGAGGGGETPGGGTSTPLPEGVPQPGTPDYDRLIGGIIHQESRGDPSRVSKAGAAGLMQLMPPTAAGLGVKDPHDPKQNVQGGVKYFNEMLRKYGNVNDALMAYNWGPGNMDKWIAGGRTGPVPKEAQEYPSLVRKWAEGKEGAQQAAKYGQFWGAGQGGPGGGPAGEPGGKGQVVTHGKTGGVDPRLVEAMTQGYKEVLPEGWKAHLTSGVRHGDPGAHGGGHALDFQIQRPASQGGGMVENRGEDKTGYYRQAAVHALAYLYEKYGEKVASTFAYGGHFGTEKGGGGPMDIMHADLQFRGPRGRHGDPLQVHRDAKKLLEQRRAERQRAATQKVASLNQNLGGGQPGTTMAAATPGDTSQMFGGMVPGGAVAQQAQRQQVASLQQPRVVNSVTHNVFNGATTPEGQQTALFQQNDKTWNRILHEPAVA